MEGIRRSCKLDEPEERAGTRMSAIKRKQFREQGFEKKSWEIANRRNLLIARFPFQPCQRVSLAGTPDPHPVFTSALQCTSSADGSSDRAGGPGGQQGDGPAGGGRAGAVGPRPPLVTSGEARTNRTHCQLRRTGLQDGNKAEEGPLARSPPPIFCRVPVRVPTARAGAWEPAERGRGPCAVAGQGD